MVGDKLNIIVLANGNFPIGMASTNRLVSYCKGLVELGHQVKVIVLCPHEKEDEIIINKHPKGVYDGIEYEYAAKTTIWPKSNFKKLYVLIFGLLRSLSQIKIYSRTKHIDALLFASGTTRFFYTIPYYFLSKSLKVLLIREKSEYPIYELHPQKYSNLYKSIARKYLYKVFDGMLIMTEPLMEYFAKVTRVNTKMVLIPMTVEPSRFSLKNEKINETARYIAYCGYLWGNKDGTRYLVDAFQIISKKHKEIKLYLIGDISNLKEYNTLIKYIESLDLTERIVFTGKVSRDEMPKYLNNAEILALARPTSLQAKGGFPTKLGEYLATGRPVIITKVGDIPKYLFDSKNAFLAEPNSSESFAERMDYALSNPEYAQKVGMEGKKLTDGIFNYKIQAKAIADFIFQLNN